MILGKTMNRWRNWIWAICLLLSAVPMARGQATTRPAAPLISTDVVARGPWLLHLPGIGGYLGCDRRLLSGLRQGGVEAQFQVYDWTEHDPGLNALHAYNRNRDEAHKIADLIQARFTADSTSPIYLTAHSGGCGLAVWALEKLPADVKVDTVLLLAPALSPGYDLSAALRHVRNHAYAFTSTNDTIVLSTGTRMFGTIDGVRGDAAGFAGFVMPIGADAQLYAKLIARPYESGWLQYDNWGDHIGPLSRLFAAAVLAPLLEPSTVASTTQPSVNQ
jgi:pimeloyl-ACP methyl ester carboxylesterase